MALKRRRVLQPRWQLSSALRTYFESGTLPDSTDNEAWPLVILDGHQEKIEVLWREYSEEVLSEWIHRKPGTRPAAWWHYEAEEPRRVLGGQTHLLNGAAELFWRADHGVPAYSGAILVESQAAYLKRLGLLDQGEGRRIRQAALKPERRDDGARA